MYYSEHQNLKKKRQIHSLISELSSIYNKILVYEFLIKQKNSGPSDAAVQAELQRGHSLLWRAGGISPSIGSSGSLYGNVITSVNVSWFKNFTFISCR